MKTRNSSWYLLVILACAVYAQSSYAGNAEQTVLALEHKWLEAQRTNNADLLEPLFADTIASTSSQGKLLSGKAAVIADSRALKWTSMDYVDEHVTVYGNTAIVTGIAKGKGTDASGKPMSENDRYTDTWAKMADGQWKCVATHTSAVKS
jgi:uncharacterized protein (TIGR02246 family)